jgi:hypothetical protein
MRALLVRIGIDQQYGGWNAPVDAESGEFVYVPIPESPRFEMRPGLGRRLGEVRAPLRAFAQRHGLERESGWSLPPALANQWAHLDPDFDTLTYGDNGARRGSRLRLLDSGDRLVFFAGLRPVRPGEHRLVYALVGALVVDEVVELSQVPAERWGENAHSRKLDHGATDLIVRGRRGESGRFQRCLPIGSRRDGAYRVRPDLLEAWGGLGVRDGFIQRSVVPPWLLDPPRFVDWLARQAAPVRASNW